MNRNRSHLVQTLFPDGIPGLWCPPLTHFTADGRIDRARMEAHLRFMAPWVKGLLVPGTTGEGWELSDAESLELLRLVLRLSRELGFYLLIGILKPTTGEMLSALDRMREEIGLPGGEEGLTFMRGARIAGFTFCAPRGKELSQETIGASFRRILEIGLPTALYQLPQVTGNEVAPETASELIRDFENLYLVKDSSGGDRILRAGLASSGVFFVRGAEGDYYDWLHRSEGAYGGFLLSTANCFPSRLAEIVASGTSAERSRSLSRSITTAVNEAFQAVGSIGHGNIFTNANKAFDHFNAYGPDALDRPEPRLHDGTVISVDVLTHVRAILDRGGLLPESGYLEKA